MNRETRNPDPETRQADPAAYALGIDLGGSSIKAVAVTRRGETLATEIEPFVDDQMQWAVRTGQLAERMQRERGRPAGAVGLSAPGLAAPDGRRIDAHAALLGEAWLGAARGLRHAFLLTLGTGVGGAAMVDGRLLRGAIGRAGHLGHISLDWQGPPDATGCPGSLELFIGNKTIRERTGGRFATTHELVNAHLAGDAAATGWWLRSVRALAAGIASLVNVLDPEAVIIGGGIARSGPALFEPLERILREMEWAAGGHRVRLLPAQLGELAGAFGAAYNALEGTQTGTP
jgi:glucokinase